MRVRSADIGQSTSTPAMTKDVLVAAIPDSTPNGAFDTRPSTTPTTTPTTSEVTSRVGADRTTVGSPFAG